MNIITTVEMNIITAVEMNIEYIAAAVEINIITAVEMNIDYITAVEMNTEYIYIAAAVEMNIREYIVFLLCCYIYISTEKTYNHQHHLTSVVVNNPQVIHPLAAAVSITDRKLGVTVAIIKIHKLSMSSSSISRIVYV